MEDEMNNTKEAPKFLDTTHTKEVKDLGLYNFLQ